MFSFVFRKKEKKEQNSKKLKQLKQKPKLDIIGFGDEGAGYGIPANERIHIALFGETGSGKSETIKLLIKQCVLRNEGFMLIDPHGMLARDVLQLIPKEKWNDVIYINPATSLRYGRAVRINPLEHLTNEDRYIVAMSFVNALRNLYRESWGDRLEAVLRNAANALVEVEGSTLRDMRMLITDAGFRFSLLRKLASKDTIHFWRETFDKQYRRDAGGAAYNKLDKILATPLVAAMLDTPRSSINFADIMHNGKFVIVDLASGTSDDIAAFLGSIVMYMLYVEAKRRIDKLESLGKPFYLFIDEAHLFSSFAIREVLNTLRKFNVKVTLATQTINAFSSRVAEEIPALCRTIICFKCDRETANMFKDLLPISVEELTSLSLHTFAFYSQGLPPSLGIARTRRMEGKEHDWQEVARKSVQNFGESVSMERYIPAKSGIYPKDLLPIDQKIIYLLRNNAMTKEQIISELNQKYGVEQQLVYESLRVLSMNHIISSSMETVEGSEQQVFQLERYAYNTYFATEYVGNRTGSEDHKAAILCIAYLLWNQLKYCKIDLGQEYGKHADLVSIEASSYDDDGNTVYDLKTWGKVTAIEVEVEPEKHEEQVYQNWRKNNEQGFDICFAVLSDEHKQFIENLLSKHGVDGKNYSIIILDKSDIEKYYGQIRTKQAKAIKEDELKVANVLKDHPATVRKIQDSTNMSEDAVVHALDSLEKKGHVERNYAEKRTSKVNLATGELIRKKSRMEYFSIKREENDEEIEEQVADDNLSSFTDEELIELIKDPECKDRDSIAIMLENRGYRVRFDDGKLNLHRRS
jgi:DNA-binding MarR family transcriptional regulator